MNRHIIYICLTMFCLLLACEDKKQEESQDVGKSIKLPLAYVEGFGPFSISFGTLQEDDTARNDFWSKTYLPVTGIPNGWTRVRKSMVRLDVFQLIYQNYKFGSITEKEFADFCRGAEWAPNLAELPDRRIQCFVYVVRGRDEKGKAAVLIDTNNDLDFGDETPFYPKIASMNDLQSIQGYEEKEKHYISYEVYENGKVVKRKVPMVVKRVPSQPSGQDFIFYFPQHARTTLKVNEKNYEIALAGGSRLPNFEYSSMVVLEEDTTRIFEYPDFIKKGDQLMLGGFLHKTSYLNKGVDLYRNALLLEEIGAATEEYALRAGYRFKPFRASEFQTGKPVTYSDFKGKYLFVDFWGTWCKPCVQELPELLKAYEELDKNKVQFISIAKDTPATLSRFLKKRPIPWTQILSDSSNKLVEIYNVTGFPTSVLVGPDGRVVAKNLHASLLRAKLDELTKQ